jgi:hypothetical protein
LRNKRSLSPGTLLKSPTDQARANVLSKARGFEPLHFESDRPVSDPPQPRAVGQSGKLSFALKGAICDGWTS